MKSNDEPVCHDGILAIGEVESSRLLDEKLYHILGQRFSSIRHRFPSFNFVCDVYNELRLFTIDIDQRIHRLERDRECYGSRKIF